MMKWTRYWLLMPVLLAQALGSCSLIDEPEYEDGGSVKTSLAFSVSQTHAGKTRMSDAVVQEQGSTYRDLEILSLIPFAISGEKVVIGDKPSRIFDFAGRVGENETPETFYLYKSYTINSGINAFLVYGRAPVGNRSKAENGSFVLPTDLVYPDLANMRFMLESFCNDNTVPVEAELLAGYLTDIAKTSGWSSTTDSKLWEFYLFFTGLENEGHLVLAGSTANVIAHVNALLGKLNNKTYETGSVEAILKAAIINNIEKTSYSKKIDNEQYTMTLSFDNQQLKGFNFVYPNRGLPDGVAAMRWVVSENEFAPQTMTTPLDNINNICRFCYPAELLYYANSRIDTSNREIGVDVYTNNTVWDDVCRQYEYRPGTVTRNTVAVAIHDPLQYAVGRLKMSVKATTGTLKDSKGNDVTLTSTAFPLTGVIVCNQHPVDFNFKPVLENGAVSHAEDRFIYDSQVGTDFYLSATEQNIPSTLVLQTFDTGEGSDMKGAEEVTIAMEFRNDGDMFYGKDCVIFPGTKFYLIGKIKPSEGTSSAENPEAKGRVFTQDHVTTVSTKVESLANAYSVLPDLIGGRLELGVELVSSWVQAETTNVILK